MSWTWTLKILHQTTDWDTETINSNKQSVYFCFFVVIVNVGGKGTSNPEIKRVIENSSNDTLGLILLVFFQQMKSIIFTTWLI